MQHREGAIRRVGRLLHADRGEKRFGESRRAREQLVVASRAPARDDGLQQLPHAPVREVALELCGARSETGEAGVGRGVTRRSQETRLAEPGRSFDDQNLTATLCGVGERVAEHAELVLSLQQCRRNLDHSVRRSTSQTSSPYTEPARDRAGPAVGKDDRMALAGTSMAGR